MAAAAVVHSRGGAVEKQIAGRKHTLLGEVDKGIAGSVRLAGEENIRRIWIEVNGDLLLKGKVGGTKLESLHFWGVHKHESTGAREIRGDDNRIRTNDGVSPLMVGTIVGVDDELHRQKRDLPDGSKQLRSFSSVEPGINYKDPGPADQKG